MTPPVPQDSYSSRGGQATPPAFSHPMDMPPQRAPFPLAPLRAVGSCVHLPPRVCTRHTDRTYRRQSPVRLYMPPPLPLFAAHSSLRPRHVVAASCLLCRTPSGVADKRPTPHSTARRCRQLHPVDACPLYGRRPAWCSCRHRLLFRRRSRTRSPVVSTRGLPPPAPRPLACVPMFPPREDSWLHARAPTRGLRAAQSVCMWVTTGTISASRSPTGSASAIHGGSGTRRWTAGLQQPLSPLWLLPALSITHFPLPGGPRGRRR
jgi:hypothetical protein